MEIELIPTDSDVNVSVSTERISDELGRQGILGDDVSREDSAYFYLASIALGTQDDEQYDLNRTLMEYIRNSREFEHVSSDAADRIEDLLR